MRAVLAAAAVAITAVAVPVAARYHGFIINTTDSGPKGLWQRTDEGVERGRWVIFCLDPSHEFVRPFVGRGPCPNGLEYFLKPVVALPGDHVRIDATGVTVNGRLLDNSAQLNTDRAGNPLPHFAMDGQLMSGKAIVISSYSPRSIDSRYFGPISLNDVVSVTKPVLVSP